MSNASAISWREQATFDDMMIMVCFVQDQHAELDFYSASSLKLQDQHAELDFYSASSLKQHPLDRRVTPLGHMYNT